MKWCYKGLGSILCDPAGPGFKRILIRPQTVAKLDGASASYESPYGRIASAWKREGGRIALNVTIPPNATATVYVPAKNAAGVTEGGMPAPRAPGVAFLRAEGGAAVYAVGSGAYQFKSDE